MGNVLGTLIYPAFHFMYSGSVPVYDGDYNADLKLTSPVAIKRDSRGMPHIEGSTLLDVVKAQGFVHAQDRLWQMESLRRVAQGRLSEVIGAKALATDKLSLGMGFMKYAEIDLEKIKKDNKFIFECIEAYSEGVNAYANQIGENLPPEFKLLGIRMDPWKPFDTACVARLLPFQMNYGLGMKICRSSIASMFGFENMKSLWAGVDEDSPPAAVDTGPNVTRPYFMEPTIDSDKLYPIKILEDVNEFTEALKKSSEYGGSNAWCISPTATDTKHPLLANDTHLKLTAPGTFYENHMRVTDGSFQCIGSSFAGVPFIIIGHNEHAAWGVTLGKVDSEDVFVEKVDWEHQKYEFAGELRDLNVNEYQINVKGESPVEYKVFSTHHGPIINKLINNAFGVKNNANTNVALSIQSMSQIGLDNLIQGYYEYNTMKNWDDFRAAGSKLIAPSLNWVFASKEDFGYQLTGQVLKRERNQLASWVAVPGWTGEYDWDDQEIIPWEEMPFSKNPTGKDYIVSCNHQPVGTSYKYFLGNLFVPGERAHRAHDLLAELGEKSTASGKAGLTVDDMVKMQGDFHFEYGLFIAKTVIDMHKENKFDLSDEESRMIDVLATWNGTMGVDMNAPSIIQVLIRSMSDRLLGPAVNTDHTNDANDTNDTDKIGLHDFDKKSLVGEGYHPILKVYNAAFSSIPCQIRHFLVDTDDDNFWMARQGGKTTWINDSLKDTFRWLKEAYGTANVDDWIWGHIHSLTIKHQMTAKAILEPTFRVPLGNAPIGGCESTLNMQGENAWKEDVYHAEVAAVVRYVYDPADWDRSVSIVQNGSSGNPYSPHYSDQLDRWIRNEPYPLHWSQEAVDAAAVHEMTLIGHTFNNNK